MCDYKIKSELFTHHIPGHSSLDFSKRKFNLIGHIINEINKNKNVNMS